MDLVFINWFFINNRDCAVQQLTTIEYVTGDAAPNHTSPVPSHDCPLSPKFSLSRAAAMPFASQNVLWIIPLKNHELHFPVIMKVSFTNYENILYFQNTTFHYKLLFNLLYKKQVNEWHHGYQFLVQSACSAPPLLYFILVPLALPVSRA